mgnify:CR=1 FL=1
MKPELRVLAASGQLGYGIPEAAFSAGIARAPHVIGADMGSIDPGPAYLGSGRMATSPEMTRRDLGLVLSAARGLGVPLLIGSAGTAGARPHLDATLEIVRGIAREKGLRFRLASIAADIPKALARDARPLGAMRAMDLEGTTHLVGQMGTEAFIRALDAGADVVVAGRALYEQEDPYTVQEPEGTLDLRGAQYEAIDARRTRVRGALWQPRARPTVKIEGAGPCGERSVLLRSSADPRVIENLSSILLDVEATTRQLVPGSDFSLYPRVYGEAETFLLVECIAPTAARGVAVLGVFRQYLLHHGFAGRLSTGGNVAFPFTPPELPAGTAYRFTVYHVMDVEALAPLFPVSIEDIA